MRVKCIAAAPSPALAEALGHMYVAGKTEYPVEVGAEYIVLGVGFWEGVAWFEIAPSMRTLVSVPAALFAIISGRPSRHWDVRMHPDGAVTLWPHSFYNAHYHDHLSEGVPEALEDFTHLLSLLEREAAP